MSIADRDDRLPIADHMQNTSRVNLDEKRMFRQSFPRSLRLIVDHATGFEQAPVDGVVYGLKAIDAWIDAFKQGTIDPIGNDYN